MKKLFTQLLLTLMILLFSGCDIVRPYYEKLGETTEIMVVYDLSESMLDCEELNSDDLNAFIFQHGGLDSNARQCINGLTLYHSYTGDISRAKIHPYTLPPGSSMENMSKRGEVVKSYMKDASNANDKLLAHQQNHDKSRIHNALCMQTKTLMNSGFSDDKTLVLLSDCLLDNDSIRFMSYANDPVCLKASFDAISQQLNAQMQMPDLTSLKVIIVTPHRKDRKHDELYRLAGDFWQYHLEKSGASVEIMSNLIKL